MASSSMKRVVMTIDEYFRGPESNRPRELVYGVVREPPAPFPYHQGVVTRLATLLENHAADTRLGDVYVSPIDVVLDEARGLVLQPDIIFVAASNRAIVRDRVWGAPDLVVEVLSSGTARRDRTAKLKWYEQYGVREYWLVHPLLAWIEVVAWCDSDAGSDVYESHAPVRSRVLPDLRLMPNDMFRR
jgi:Uma2 family endonuclease